jgi:putative phosphoribosyl transferase
MRIRLHYSDMVTLPFRDRHEAGLALARELKAYKGKKNALILALVRGGVMIGEAMARELKLPLYPYVVRKLGHPDHREFGLGALAEGGSTHLDEVTMHAYGVEWYDMEPVIDEEMEELSRRKKAYMVNPRPDLKGKTVILTDDGAATGVSMLAAIEDLRKANVKKIIVALPVAPPETAEALWRHADQVIVLSTPALFDAVGKWYVEFPQVEDNEVLAVLR